MMRFLYEKVLFSARHSAFVLVALTAFLSVAAAQQPVTLRPGIVIDTNNNTIYAMTPEGITAVDLTSGTKRWATTAAAKPLALYHNLLLTQVEPKNFTSTLELATLKTNQRGAVANVSRTDLPETVNVAIGQTFKGNFETEARLVANTAFITWRFEPRPPLQGRRAKAEGGEVSAVATPVVSDSLKAAIHELTTEGAVNLNLTTGTAVKAESGETVAAAGARQWRLPTEERVSGAPPTQYESGDKLYIMASERIADSNTWDKYRWTIYERESNKRIGEFRTRVSFAPFVVKGSILIYESTPFVREGKAEPAKLRGVNLTTGKEEWSIEVRENIFRGPFPP